MTIDEAPTLAESIASLAARVDRAVAERDTLRAEVDRLTAERGVERTKEWRALRAEVDRLRSLPVIPYCAECAHCVKGSARHRCEHPAAPLDDSGKAHAAGRRGPMGQCRTVEPDGEPPSWCPWRKVGGR